MSEDKKKHKILKLKLNSPTENDQKKTVEKEVSKQEQKSAPAIKNNPALSYSESIALKKEEELKEKFAKPTLQGMPKIIERQAPTRRTTTFSRPSRPFRSENGPRGDNPRFPRNNNPFKPNNERFSKDSRPERPDRGDRPNRSDRPDRPFTPRPNGPRFGNNSNSGTGHHSGPRPMGTGNQFNRSPRPMGAKPFSFPSSPFPPDIKKPFDADRKKKRTSDQEKNKNTRTGTKGFNNNRNVNVTDFVGRIDSNHLEANSFNDMFTKKRRDKAKAETAIFIKRDIEIAGPMSIKDIATKMAMRSAQVLEIAKKVGLNTNDKANIAEDILQIIVEEAGHTPIRLDEKNKAQLEFPKLELDPAKSKSRPPVVVVVGHVDHGKTSLLDKIRKSNLTKREAGGITQSIGAYQVHLKEGDITFIDTPGHEAFTSMRSRGVNITDIAILVVSSEDSIKPQTIEAITHIKAANVPIIVAITKADLHSANIEKVKNDLLSHEIIAEEFGGDVPCIPVSALSGLNIDKLLKTILLQAELMELKANDEVSARGIVLESKINPKIGAVATLLVQQGTLKKMAFCIAGVSSGKIKAMTDADGKQISEAKAGTPVEVIGLDIAPSAGSEFAQITDMKIANTILEARKLKHSQENKSAGMNMRMENFLAEPSPTVNLIIRTDTQGSLEALKLALSKLNSAEAETNFILSGVGPVKESDIDLAVISNANIVAFNVKTPSAVQKVADNNKIKIIEHNIIYNLIEEIEQQLLGLIKPEEKEVWIGTARVQQLFSSSKLGNIAGCIVTSGVIRNNTIAKVIRQGKTILETKIENLKRNKDDAKEVSNGLECGILLADHTKIAVDDEIECYKIELIKKVLEKK